LAVLGDEQRDWRPDVFGYSLWGCSLQSEFPVVKLLDYAELQSNRQFGLSAGCQRVEQQPFDRVVASRADLQHVPSHHSVVRTVAT